VTSGHDTASEIAKLRADQASLLETVLAMQKQMAAMTSPRIIARSSSVSGREAGNNPPPLLIPAAQITRATEDELIAMRKVFALFDSSGHGESFCAFAGSHTTVGPPNCCTCSGIIDAKDLQALHQKL
jgi:hypothetical protein